MRPELEEALNHLRAAAAIIKRIDAIDNPPFETTEPGASFLTAPDAHPDPHVMSRADFDAAHAQWYECYWRKVGRADSRKAFEKRARALMNERNWSLFTVTGYLKKMASQDRQRFEGTDDWSWRSSLHPATWLNGSRWEDQAPEAVQQTKGPTVGYDRL